MVPSSKRKVARILQAVRKKPCITYDVVREAEVSRQVAENWLNAFEAEGLVKRTNLWGKTHWVWNEPN